MKIIKYVKLRGNKYKIKIEGYDDVILYDSIIIKNNLLLKKNINENELDCIVAENNEYESYDKALKYINKKRKTRKEIYGYLLKMYDIEVVNKAVEKLDENGFLNDENYIRAYINDQVNLTNHGPYRILNNLVKLGFEKNLVLEYLDCIDKDVFLNKINKYIEKKINGNSRYSNKMLKDKIQFELGNLGYEKNDVVNELTNYSLDREDSILEKEYIKVYQKLSKKYEGYELENKVAMKLMAKGFFYEDIKRVKKIIKKI